MRKGGKEGSWESVSSWYGKEVGKKGHYYHKRIVIPGVLRMLALKEGDSLLDLACGQGVLARAIPEGVGYVGVDISKSLVSEARKLGAGEFHVGDVTLPLKGVGKRVFSHAAVVLALQNISDPVGLFKNLERHIKSGGRAVLVLNHPCYRIPKESHWDIDVKEDRQSRRVDRYHSNFKIPIQSNPSKGKGSSVTYSYHFPLDQLITWIVEAGFVLCGMEEWVSDKKSYGSASARENRARKEFPMFMAVTIQKR